MECIFASNGSQIPQNGKLYNIYPNDKPNIVDKFELVRDNGEWKINRNGKLETPKEGVYTFVTQDGKIYVGDGRNPFHIDLSGGKPVDYAGELNLISIKGKIQVGEWANNSGHYRPGNEYADRVGLPLENFRDASSGFIFF